MTQREVEWTDVSEGYFTSTLPQVHPRLSHPVLPFTRIWGGVSIASDTPCGLADVDISGLERNNPYPTAFPYGNGMVLNFYQQQESSATKTAHKVINKGLKTYV